MLRESLCPHKAQKKRATFAARFQKPCAKMCSTIELPQMIYTK